MTGYLTTFAGRGVMLVALLALGGCATTATLAPFSTDRCSMFPDRAPGGGADWCGCCVAHDLAYWRGGSAAERLESDQAFQRCVRTASRSPALAGVMYKAVRVAGAPWTPTAFRWAYGWPYGRAYQSLTAEEQARADSLRDQYLAREPAACTVGWSGPREAAPPGPGR